MTCANCARDAVAYVDELGANPLAFCGEHFPPHLRTRLAAGEFALPKDQVKASK